VALSCGGILTIFYASSGKLLRKYSALIALLSVLKVKKPELYIALKETKQDLEKLLASLELTKINDRDAQYYIGPMQKLLRFCLLTEEEFDQLDENDKAREEVKIFERNFPRGRMSRRELIPSICKTMDMYRVDIINSSV
jgi:hypothetical protein